jgi:hypothetical protein
VRAWSGLSGAEQGMLTSVSEVMTGPMTSHTKNRAQVCHCSCRMRNSDARTPNAGTTGISGSRKDQGASGRV